MHTQRPSCVPIENWKNKHQEHRLFTPIYETSDRSDGWCTHRLAYLASSKRGRVVRRMADIFGFTSIIGPPRGVPDKRNVITMVRRQ